MKPKVSGVVVAVVDAEETDAEPDGVPVGDDEIGIESEAAVDSEVDAESRVGVKAEPVRSAVPMEGTMVLAGSLAEIPTEELVAVPDASAAQPVADTVMVDTRVTVTMLSVPMTTVGVTIPFDAEEVVTAVAVLDEFNEAELGSTDVGVGVATDDVVTTAVEDVKI